MSEYLGAGASFLGSLVGGISNFLGANSAANGAADAARIQGKYNMLATDKILAENQKARDELNAARARGLGYIDTGLGQYKDTINPLLTSRPIVLPTYRGLTTQQRLGLSDLERTTGQQLAGSGMRGAGRAGVGVALDARRRFITAARGANDADTLGETRAAQGRADAARTGLAGVELGVGGAKAGVDTGTANNLASSFQQGGAQAGSLLANTGQAKASAANTAGNLYGGATVATGNLFGQNVGQSLAGGSSPNQGFGLSSMFGGGGSNQTDTGDWTV